MTTTAYIVPGMSCGHCKSAIEAEVALVPGVVAVNADPESKHVVVEGDVDDVAVRAAIDRAGYDIA
jgi:copper chaperone